MSDTGLYSIDDLSNRTGTTVRTIRYYVQEGLIDPPRGRGRGRHFDDTHLDQLKRIRLLQLAGFNLASIKAKGGDLIEISKRLNAHGLFALEALSVLNTDQQTQISSERTKTSNDAVIIPLADGVDLRVQTRLKITPPKDLVEIALLVRKAFGERG